MRSVAGEGSLNKFNAEIVARPSFGATRRPLLRRGRGTKSAFIHYAADSLGMRSGRDSSSASSSADGSRTM